ncbi:MAG: hypothetical protein HON68_07265 [Gammaproteobacteria bacterium]|nr:hypothetical protein [Gammaproteobacteria bacterium]MBT3488291.1 hypothetical protein [Gammaproteobacteria bacterium]MBT3717879.1 hypothetical protein [Gammaproteobacteria bacterium]MBT3843807.1 hypothetical protein [Gammaproteobacteria bacterium]MBT3893737.1 hypothetical protein [Gammaproteobacteria bacterium]
MPLSSEDQLRIQVMLHNSPQALRVDETHMVLYALTPAGEATIPLSPNEPNDKYLRSLRGMLSEHLLGSAGGYPLYLKRWSRMGQTGEQHLKSFLLLAEPEAVSAVANSPDLNLELARRVWWAVTNTAQQAEQGLHLLHSGCVVENSLGGEIAQFLMEHLPFLTEPEEVLQTLSAVLQKGLLAEQQVEKIWQRSQARGKGIYQIAFLQARPLALPDQAAAHPRDQQWQKLLAPLIAENWVATQLLRASSSQGQTFIQHVIAQLSQVPNELSAYALMNAIGGFFSVSEIPQYGRDLSQVDTMVSEQLEREVSTAVLTLEPQLQPYLKAIFILSQVREEVIFKSVLHSGSVGRSLRQKLTVEFELIQEQLEQLQH